MPHPHEESDIQTQAASAAIHKSQTRSTAEEGNIEIGSQASSRNRNVVKVIPERINDMGMGPTQKRGGEVLQDFGADELVGAATISSQRAVAPSSSTTQVKSGQRGLSDRATTKPKTAVEVSQVIKAKIPQASSVNKDSAT